VPGHGEWNIISPYAYRQHIWVYMYGTGHTLMGKILIWDGIMPLYFNKVENVLQNKYIENKSYNFL